MGALRVKRDHHHVGAEAPVHLGEEPPFLVPRDASAFPAASIARSSSRKSVHRVDVAVGPSSNHSISAFRQPFSISSNSFRRPRTAVPQVGLGVLRRPKAHACETDPALRADSLTSSRSAAEGGPRRRCPPSSRITPSPGTLSSHRGKPSDLRRRDPLMMGVESESWRYSEISRSDRHAGILTGPLQREEPAQDGGRTGEAGPKAKP